VERAGQTGLTAIRMGFTPNALSDHLPAAMRSLKVNAPLVNITLVEANTPDQIDGLASGELDVGFFNPPSTRIRRLDVRVVAQTRVVAAIPADWPLARAEEIRLANLADTPLLLFPAQSRADIHAAIMAAFRQAGVTPTISQEATFDYTRLKLSAAGMGVSLVNETTAPRGYPGVVQRPIVDLPSYISVDLVMAWRSAVAASTRRLYQLAADAAAAAQG
jgi:DNA-binding transcriptional LysR family regulator